VVRALLELHGLGRVHGLGASVALGTAAAQAGKASAGASGLLLAGAGRLRGQLLAGIAALLEAATAEQHVLELVDIVDRALLAASENNLGEGSRTRVSGQRTNLHSEHFRHLAW
jgi:hypothetical protein